jgi:hypothetical protein
LGVVGKSVEGARLGLRSGVRLLDRPRPLFLLGAGVPSLERTDDDESLLGHHGEHPRRGKDPIDVDLAGNELLFVEMKGAFCDRDFAHASDDPLDEVRLVAHDQVDGI